MHRFLIALALLLVLLPSQQTSAARLRSTGYTVSRTAKGIRLTLHFQHRRYPKRALVWVTTTLTNLSHRNLYTSPPIGQSRPARPCTWPVTIMQAVDVTGQSAEPISPVPQPVVRCPAPKPSLLPLGHSVLERQLVVLWTGRIHALAYPYQLHGHGYESFEMDGPTTRLSLFQAPAPSIHLDVATGSARVEPPPNASGPMYFRSWGTCGGQPIGQSGMGWQTSRRTTISQGCIPAEGWHIDAGWINSPVASVNLTHR